MAWAKSRFLASTPTGKERLSGTPAALGMTERKASAKDQIPRGLTNRGVLGAGAGGFADYQFGGDYDLLEGWG